MFQTTDVTGAITESGALGGRVSGRAQVTWPLLVAAAILYGSLIPFQVDWSMFTLNGRGLSLPSLEGTTLEDAVTNVLVYMPLGAALILCLGRASLIGLAATVISAGAMSLAVETLQSAMRLRVASLTDVMLNVGGAALGAVLAIALKSPIVRILSGIRSDLSMKPIARVASVLTVGLLLYSLTPFSFVTDARSLYASFGRARWNLDTTQFASVTHWPLRSMFDHSVQAVWFAALGFVLTLARRERGGASMTAFAYAVKHGGILVCLIEFMQLFTPLHCFDTSVLVLRGVAVALGACVAAFTVGSASLTSWFRRPTRITPASVFVMLGLVQLLAIFVPELQKLGGSRQGLQATATHWIPFFAVWRLPMDRAVVEVISVVATYATLAATGIMILRRWYASKAAVGAIAATVATAVAVELMARCSAIGGADVTNPILALSAAIGVSKLLAFLESEQTSIHPPSLKASVSAPVFTRHT